jgi:hypothetical protein
MKLFLKTVALPGTLLVLNYALQFLYSFVPAPFGVITFNLVRLLLAAWAGWRVTSRRIGGLTQAAAAGAVLLFVDHVIIRGGSFLVAQMVAPGWVDNKGFQGFGGVLVSYVMFVWIPVVFSIAGGVFGRRVTVAA